MARLAVLAVALLLVAAALAQNAYVLDNMSVGQTSLSLSTSGTISNYACASTSGASTTGLAGGIRSLQLSAPAGTSVQFAVQLGVFIPSGQTTAPNGVSSGNNNLNSPTFQVLYRLDGNSNACGSGQNTQANSALSKNVNNLNINLQSIGAYAFQFNALGDVTPNQVTVTLYTSSGTQMAKSNPITVQNSGSNPTFTAYTLNFNDNTKWTSGSSFSGTVGAVELTWAEPSNLQFAVNLVEFLVQATTTVGATVFNDCGCNGFVQNSGDTLQPGVSVTLAVSGAGCTASTQSQVTSSQGTVSFTNIAGGCTYTLSVAGLNLCSNSASSQNVAAGGTAAFAINPPAGGLQIPTDRTVNCGTDTSPTTTGTATGGGGSCGTGSGTPTFTDVVTPQTCSAPGGTISVIKRTWSLTGVPSQTQTITVVDTKTIALSGVPNGSTLSCNQAVPVATVTGVACTPVAVTNKQTNTAGTCDTTTCTSTGSVTVTYTGTDQCGNTATRSVTYQQTGCNVTCPPPPPPAVVPPPPNAPPPTQLPTNANCRFICDDDDSSAMHLAVSAVLAVVLALAAAF